MTSSISKSTIPSTPASYATQTASINAIELTTSAVWSTTTGLTSGTTQSVMPKSAQDASWPTTLDANTAPTQTLSRYRLDRDAIIAGAVVGTLLVVIIVVSLILARAKRRRATRGGEAVRSKTPRPTPAGACALVREPNPYTNPCFNATKEEMGERAHKTEEPSKNIAEAINSVRNKEDHWIIPLEELAEDDATANYDTTKF